MWTEFLPHSTGLCPQTGAAAQKGTKASAQAIESSLFIPLHESAPSRQNSAQSRGNFRMLHIVDMSFWLPPPCRSHVILVSLSRHRCHYRVASCQVITSGTVPKKMDSEIAPISSTDESCWSFDSLRNGLVTELWPFALSERSWGKSGSFVFLRNRCALYMRRTFAHRKGFSKRFSKRNLFFFKNFSKTFPKLRVSLF